jgi:hypothetical protein
VLGVTDVDFMTAVVFPCIANVEMLAVCGAQVSLLFGVMCASTLHPSGAKGFAL